jgi:hypothetical protein
MFDAPGMSFRLAIVHASLIGLAAEALLLSGSRPHQLARCARSSRDIQEVRTAHSSSLNLMHE